jgi:tetratricopeptide (TPR) repeat protein
VTAIEANGSIDTPRIGVARSLQDESVAMKFDSRGLAVTTESDDAIHAIDHYAHELLSLGTDAAAVQAAADANPDCAMLQACAASTFLYSQTTAGSRKGAPYLARAETRLGELTEREQVFIGAVKAGCAGDFESALALYEQIADRWPRDMVAAKLAEFHFFETGLASRQLDLMRKAAAANSDKSHVLAMHAFALELNAERERADEVARAALAIDPNTMWAQHCRAHVFAGQSRIAEGIAAMEDYAPSWQKFSHYTVAHNWFHLATLYLSELRFDDVRNAYRKYIWGNSPEAVVEQTDSILLLWYLELSGEKVDAEWRAIAPHIRANAHDTLFPFLNCVYLYALTRAGETKEVASAIAGMERHAEKQTGTLAHVWREVGLPLARGCVAFGAGDYDRAAALIQPILDEVACIGGSDEQRGVFAESHLVSLIQAGRKSEARTALTDHINGRPETALELRWAKLI